MPSGWQGRDISAGKACSPLPVRCRTRSDGRRPRTRRSSGAKLLYDKSNICAKQCHTIQVKNNVTTQYLIKKEQAELYLHLLKLTYSKKVWKTQHHDAEIIKKL